MIDADKLATNLDELGRAHNIPCLRLYADQVRELGQAAAERNEPMNGTPLEKVLADIRDERVKQHEKWGEQNHRDGTGPHTSPLTRITPGADQAMNLSYAARKATDQAAEAGTVTYADILLEEVFEAMAEYDPVDLRRELVQVAAVAAQWIEAIDRRGAQGATSEGHALRGRPAVRSPRRRRAARRRPTAEPSGPVSPVRARRSQQGRPVNRIPARDLSGRHIGRTARARIAYPFTGPQLVTGELVRVEHRTDGIAVILTDTAGPRLVPLDLDDSIELDPVADPLQDPDGRALVQAIHERKDQP